jgi:hypothetical protein
MPVRRRGNKLERWEIALIKAMVADGRWPNDQDILAYFTRPTRSINHRAIAEIRTGTKHTAVKASAPEELDSFLVSWPEVDAETGLSLRGDELLIKAREAMIAAVHTFNSAGLTFRAELFVVTAIIAWTYLLHTWFRREGIDYRYTKNQGGEKVVVKTQNGAEKYWDLSQCLKHARCPIEAGARSNLELLLELRHEIEHRCHKDPIRRTICSRTPTSHRLTIRDIQPRPARAFEAGQHPTAPHRDDDGHFRAAVDTGATGRPTFRFPRLHGP